MAAAAACLEEELAVGVQLLGEHRRQSVEADELVDAVPLRLVSGTRGVELSEQLGNITKDGGVQARPGDLADEGK